MTETVLDIKRWGNSLGVRLPVAIAKIANLHLDQKVRLSAEKGKVIISPIVNEFATLEQRLARFDPDIHNGEAMQISALMGAEKI